MGSHEIPPFEMPGNNEPFPDYPISPNIRRMLAPQRIERCLLPFGNCLVAGGGEETIEASTLIVCRPLQLCIPHSIAHKVDVKQLVHGKNSLFGSMSVMPGESFCERRVIAKGVRPIDWRTLRPGEAVRLTLHNKSHKAVRIYAYFVVVQVGY